MGGRRLHWLPVFRDGNDLVPLLTVMVLVAILLHRVLSLRPCIELVCFTAFALELASHAFFLLLFVIIKR